MRYNDEYIVVERKKYMNWSEKLQKIIDYVETHLQRKEEPIDREVISVIAGCSYSFFQKVFSYMNGISFADYIRNRKLTLAGYDLKSSNIKVIDVSYKYGYSSPTSFTKAFQQFHGISPSQAKERNTELKIYPKMKIDIKSEYSWRLERKPSFRLVGKKITVSCNKNEHFIRIPAFWNSCQKDGTISNLISMDEAHMQGLMGVSSYLNKRSNEMEYSIMVTSKRNIELGFIEQIIPEMTWAVFDCFGMVPEAIQNGWNYLNEEWLLKYPFKHANCPEIEWYSNGSPYNDDYLSQIWIPIIEED